MYNIIDAQIAHDCSQYDCDLVNHKILIFGFYNGFQASVVWDICSTPIADQGGDSVIVKKE